MGRILALKSLLKSGRLVLRLVRDQRVPGYAKLVLGGGLLYALMPLDVVPDWIPLLGQMDDFAALAAGLALFIRLCPREVVEEHQDQLGHRPRKTVEGRARPVPPDC